MNMFPLFFTTSRGKTIFSFGELSTKPDALGKYIDVRSSYKSHSALITSLH